MEIKTTKKNGGKKPKRVLAPQKLTRLELKHAKARDQVLSLARRPTETIKFPKSYRGRRRGREALSDERGFAPIYAADKYVQQEAGEPQSIGRVALRPFQFRSRASDAALYARYGRWLDGSAMVGRGS